MQEILDNSDYVACLGIQTTLRKVIGDSKLCEIEKHFTDDNITDAQFLKTRIEEAENEGSYVFSRIVEIDWCIYNLKDSKVEADQTFLIIPGANND